MWDNEKCTLNETEEEREDPVRMGRCGKHQVMWTLSAVSSLSLSLRCMMCFFTAQRDWELYRCGSGSSAFEESKCSGCCGSGTFSSDIRRGGFDKREKKREGKMKVVCLPASGKRKWTRCQRERGGGSFFKGEMWAWKTKRPTTAGCWAELHWTATLKGFEPEPAPWACLRILRDQAERRGEERWWEKS